MCGDLFRHALNGELIKPLRIDDKGTRERFKVPIHGSVIGWVVMVDQNVFDKCWPVARVDQLLPVGDALLGVKGSDVIKLLEQARPIVRPVGVFRDQETRTDARRDFDMDAR
jgi:hypothetical protein